MTYLDVPQVLVATDCLVKGTADGGSRLQYFHRSKYGKRRDGNCEQVAVCKLTHLNIERVEVVDTNSNFFVVVLDNADEIGIPGIRGMGAGPVASPSSGSGSRSGPSSGRRVGAGGNWVCRRGRVRDVTGVGGSAAEGAV